MMSIKLNELDRRINIADEVKRVNEIKEFLEDWCKKHNRIITGHLTIKNEIGEYGVDISMGSVKIYEKR